MDPSAVQNVAIATNTYTLRYSWPGRNPPICAGRCLRGPDPGILFVTSSLLIVMPCICLWNEAIPLSPIGILSVVLPIVVLEFLLFRASFTEPGIIPRLVKAPARIGSDPAPTVKIGTRTVALTWCYTCLHWKPIRTHHCREIDCCVMEMDHYCPWISNCVGKRNYRHYVLFVWLSSALDIYAMGSQILLIVEWVDSGWPSNQWIPIISCVATFVLFLLLWGLFPLALYHAWLIAKGKTTAEHVKGIDMVSLYEHPSSCLGNYRHIFRRPIPESLVDLGASCDIEGRIASAPILVVEPNFCSVAIPEILS
uniref:Palmitoyltransferase n=1 Tax=Spongospora subterranea TaxID=70186 RepID=A0A0H5RC40_9EUKA|eukprot:CRZ11608.1 hypothetical protein [Spongospora subterranea]